MTNSNDRAKKRAEVLRSQQTKHMTFAEIQRAAAKAQNTPPSLGGPNILPTVTNNRNVLRMKRNTGPGVAYGFPLPPNPEPPSIPQNATVNHTPSLKPLEPLPVVKPEFSREPYLAPTYKVLDVPDWFSSRNPTPHVSIVIPLYRSKSEVNDLIRSWDIGDEITKEIIFVSDACPQQSEQQVINSCKEKHLTGIGKIILLGSNSGYPTSCNVGALHARGKYLLFLNADTTVTTGWIKPMIDLMEDPQIGLVGNLQLKQDGSIDSAGSQWMWDNRTFEHIGRNVYNGKRIWEQVKYNKLPPDLAEPSERDMVTGCCFVIRKDLFDTIGGFDVGYRIGYWEDSDLNMEVRSRGYKIYYQPKSVIYHKSGHSRAGLHPFIMDNARRFYNKWVDNFKIDSLVKAQRPQCPK